MNVAAPMNAQLRALAHDMGQFLNHYRAILPSAAMADSYALHNRLNAIAWGAALAAPKEAGAPVLIGWRSADYTMETADKGVAQNWAANISVLPIFAGDPNTKLADPSGDQRQEGRYCDACEQVVTEPCQSVDCSTPESPPPEAAAAVGEFDAEFDDLPNAVIRELRGPELREQAIFWRGQRNSFRDLYLQSQAKTARLERELADARSACKSLAAQASPTGVDELLRECYEWLFDTKSDGPRVSEGALAKGCYTREFHDFHDRLKAALAARDGAK